MSQDTDGMQIPTEQAESKVTEKIDRAPQIAPYRFKPGQSGNPSGLPKGTVSLVAAIKKILREDPARLDALAAKVVERAEKNLDGKEFVYVKEIIERFDGKVSDKVVIERNDTNITEFTIDDLREFKAYLADKRKANIDNVGTQSNVDNVDNTDNVDNVEAEILANAPSTSSVSKTDGV